ncbi:somatomedin-B and thrombospondin type-1 domain-containing protein [Xenopus laevis]|uniref:SMB domain-containing protein n=2 Tax=Xenopus laevis TaxID=8355 RepID=A0A974HEB7_XENLA|nr:somatomedin-B and thrombospondin type-1 domain-containing protein [Xenopus laevis]OCT74809.1 hypothetical protein XELAEV_18033796mg [Xenopus laevis]
MGIRSERRRSVWMLLLLLLGLATLICSAEGGCREAGKCCQGRDMNCTSQGWRMDRVYGTCFCDQTCRLTGDCCSDYSQACPARACVVGEWSHWSGCADPCTPAIRVRRRQVVQEPENGGDPCPSLEEKAGCLEYLTSQGTECAQSHVTAFITTFEYNKSRRRRALSPNWASQKEDPGYCVEFQVKSLSQFCLIESRPHARWMQYLREGYTVCVACQHPAMNNRNHRCYGDGRKANRLLHWKAVGNPQCQGTWKKVKEVESCSCPLVHSFIFT